MAKLGEYLAPLLIVVLVAPILLMDIHTGAQTIPKPSVPEFTVRFVDNSYDVEPRYSYDPYTGNNVLAENGYHVQNKTI